MSDQAIRKVKHSRVGPDNRVRVGIIIVGNMDDVDGNRHLAKSIRQLHDDTHDIVSVGIVQRAYRIKDPTEVYIAAARITHVSAEKYCSGGWGGEIDHMHLLRLIVRIAQEGGGGQEGASSSWNVPLGISISFMPIELTSAGATGPTPEASNWRTRSSRSWAGKP